MGTAKRDWVALTTKAHTAGMAALEAATPRPMTVTGGGKSWHVPEGVCGFAWIKIKGNTAFGRWAKKAGVASKSYPTGLMIWVGVGGQSYERKTAYAGAYAKVLTEAGITAYANSRLD